MIAMTPIKKKKTYNAKIRKANSPKAIKDLPKFIKRIETIEERLTLFCWFCFFSNYGIRGEGHSMEYFHFKPYNHMLIQMNEMKLIILTNSSKINGNIRKSMNSYSFCWKLGKIIKNSKMWPTSRKLKWIKGGGGTFVRLKTSGNIHEIYNLFCVNHQLKDIWIKLKIKERKWSNVNNHQTFKETKITKNNPIQFNSTKHPNNQPFNSTIEITTRK